MKLCHILKILDTFLWNEVYDSLMLFERVYYSTIIEGVGLIA